jgi:hypothetical protein
MAIHGGGSSNKIQITYGVSLFDMLVGRMIHLQKTKNQKTWTRNDHLSNSLMHGNAEVLATFRLHRKWVLLANHYFIVAMPT